ncbi:hypothetical protein GUJ93_ZPchr0006g44379 [Zizania palustris]|uniref:SBP-type domain-containing protein n=1 Tax=Zizania palustris TaxID=103762 RepID=A0A8J5VPD8_ZIZPA|nr:hypothetical protein GUJ93_ZPchr0006g44379 [Zizania palustris]
MECTPVAAPSSSSPPPPPPPLLWDWDATAGDADGRKRGKRSGGGSPAVGEARVRCQVEGCGVGLGGCKEYYRKHRVCEVHTKCPRVVVAGKERRFCQQCSRFHALSEFDQKKRSCRRRLSDHNARRRKPQTDVFAFGSTTLPGSLFDNSQQISFSLNKAPLSHVNTSSNSSWTSDLQLSQVIGISERSPKAWADNGNINLSKSCLSNAFPTVCHDIDEHLPIKGADASGTASKLDGALDVQRALSLLSASSWALTDPGHQTSSLIQFTDSYQNSRLPTVSNEGNPNLPFWIDEQLWR